jgi:predicted ATPase/DNA-binding CsgD family transcriptional regulator
MEDFSSKLPLQLTSFVGRERELHRIKELLASTRLLTLTGAGGSGKTRLASRVASDLLGAGEFADGVRWVDFSPILDPTFLTQAVAKAVGVHETPDVPLHESLANHLRQKHLLLVLDNCEHLILASARLCETLLSQCPDLKILATSREALSVPAEQVWLVPPLSLPDPRQSMPLDKLAQSEAIRLLIERARAVKPEFALTSQNATASREICQRLDGMPLAIELVAARLKVMSAEQIAARLDDRFHLLTLGSRTALPRHQTLQALIDWSYDLLPEAERTLLRRLSVFVGGWTLEAAEEVCAAADIERRQVLDLLTHLVDKSLVLVEEGDGAARYRFLETIRQYAQEKLRESGETEAIRDRHLAHFLALAEDAEAKLTGAERRVALGRFESDYANLRAAVAWSQTIADGELEMRLAGALSEFWNASNYASEGQQLLDRALARSQDFKPSPAILAKVLLGAGRVTSHLGALTTAQSRLMESLTLFKKLGDKRHAAYALSTLGWLSGQEGNHAQGRAQLEESVRLAREVGDKWLLQASLSILGDILQHAGFPEAGPVLEESLTLAHELGDKRSIAYVLIYSSEVDLRQGNYATAWTRREEALAIFRETGKKQDVAWALGSLGELARLQGDYARAGALYEESLPLSEEWGSQHGWILHNLGHVAQYYGETTRAAELFKESLMLRNRAGEKEGMAEALAGLAGVAAAEGQPERAARLFGAAEALREAIHLSIRLYNRTPYDRYLPIARAQSDEERFTRAWAEGKAMSLKQAIDYASTGTLPLREALAAPTALLPPSMAAKREFGGLTPREREVAALIAQGRSNRAIAEALVVEVKTVEVHITHILDKLGFSSRAQIAGWAVGKGLAPPPQDMDEQMHKN